MDVFLKVGSIMFILIIFYMHEESLLFKGVSRKLKQL